MFINWEEDKGLVVFFTIILVVMVVLMYKVANYTPYDTPSLRCHDEHIVESRVIPTSFNEPIAQRIITARGSYTIYTNTSFSDVTEVCMDKNSVTTISSLAGEKWLIQ